MNTRSFFAFASILIIAFSMTCGSATNASAQSAGNAIEFAYGDLLTAKPATTSITHITIECWLNPSSDSQFALPVFIGNGSSNGFGFVMHNGLDATPGQYVSVILGGVTFSVTGNAARVPKNMWTHLAMTRGDSVWMLYKNGVLVGRGLGTPFPPTVFTLMGKLYSGKMDEVRIWNRELSQAEIRATMDVPLKGDEASLVAYYPMNESGQGSGVTIHNKATSTGAMLDAKTSGGATSPVLAQNALPMFSSAAPQFSLSHFPQHQQFFPRTEGDTATINISGGLLDQTYDSSVVETYRNDILIRTASSPLFNATTQPTFSYSTTIRAELAQYTYRLYAKKSNALRFLTEGADIVCGDALMICGQSNSHPSNATDTYISPYLRTYGIQTSNLNYTTYDVADTLWGMANATGFGGVFSGPYLTGVWGLRLQQLIQDHHGIPVCVINGGAGASSIEQNARNDAAPQDISSIYGRMLFRATRSGMKDHFRAILWHQGEANTIQGYYQNFKTLFNNWHIDYPSVKQVYLFQIHPGCAGGPHTALRDLERSMSDSLMNVHVMSTVALPGHDGCHYALEGYYAMAQNIFRLLDRDLYAATDTINIDPPNIRAAFYTNATHNEIAVLFRQPHPNLTLQADTLVGLTTESLKSYFYLGNDTGIVQSLAVIGDTLLLTLTRPDTTAALTYLPDQNYNGTATVYEGPWIVNNRSIGALSFFRFPITERPIVGVNQSATLQPGDAILSTTPNPFHNSSEIRYSLAKSEHVTIRVCNALGVTIATLQDGVATAGEHVARFDAPSSSDALANGSYFVTLTTNNHSETRAMVQVK
jgi:hypothetical protein